MNKFYDIKLDNLNWHDYLDNPVVYYNFQYDINSVIGKATYFNQKKNRVTVELNNKHPLVQTIKQMGVATELRAGYIENADPELPGIVASLNIVIVRPSSAEYVRKGTEIK